MTGPGHKVALIALGANLAGSTPGNAAVLDRALARIGADLGPVTASRFWVSPAWPPGSGPDFVNACAVVGTALDPAAVLAVLHRIEAEAGRARDRRWAPRTLDLDLLGQGGTIAPDAAEVARWMALSAADQARLAPAGLILPHPRLHERGFVLLPLAEVAPDWVHPVLGRTVAQMAADLPETARQGLVPLLAPM